ncbi:MAG: hypothetical protein HYS32_04525 [Candidatus Woesearchaeota archaeon]|nr:MAG: hypothetical protein HYS32_04525 [Candidatus Woesearchaeota archaeon]
MAQTISIEQVYEELKKIEERMITKKELESLIETIEILNNPDTTRQVVESEEDIKKGKVKLIKSAEDLLDEL